MQRPDHPGNNNPVSATAFAPRKNADIEVLRAFAILFTLFLHFRALLPQGSPLVTPLAWLNLSVGVDLFLVISGYVITGSLMESGRDPTTPARALILSFWIKRIFRLLPAAWTWILAAAVLQLTVSSLTESDLALRDIAVRSAAAAFNFMNVYVPLCIADGTGEFCVRQNYLGHYWSLSLEEQFYLVFPLLFFFLPRRGLAAFIACAIALQFMWHRPFFTLPWYLKTDALSWGILLALLAQSRLGGPLRGRFPASRFLLPLVGGLLLVVLPLVASEILGMGPKMRPYGVAVVALLCACIVLLAIPDQGAYALGKRYRSLMLYLGSRSYALYLCHLVIYKTLRDLSGHFLPDSGTESGTLAFSLALAAVATALTLMCAELTYRRIEVPIRARGRELAGRLVGRSRQRTD
jgi:peptidoglycan/LPS O-acetylase OafA/YrhL